VNAGSSELALVSAERERPAKGREHEAEKDSVSIAVFLDTRDRTIVSLLLDFGLRIMSCRPSTLASASGMESDVSVFLSSCGLGSLERDFAVEKSRSASRYSPDGAGVDDSAMQGSTYNDRNCVTERLYSCCRISMRPRTRHSSISNK
jgi:hypothetical protein